MFWKWKYGHIGVVFNVYKLKNYCDVLILFENGATCTWNKSNLHHAEQHTLKDFKNAKNENNYF